MQGLLLLMLMIMLTGPDGEPKITHGYTLVSELSLMEVVKTINVSISLFCICIVIYNIMYSGVCFQYIVFSSYSVSREPLLQGSTGMQLYMVEHGLFSSQSSLWVNSIP